mgnify:CR=1 FL=1
MNTKLKKAIQEDIYRYYGTYTSGAVALSFLYMVEKEECLKKVSIKIIVGVLLVLKWFWKFVLPFVADTGYLGVWFVYPCLSDFKESIGFALSLVIFTCAIIIIFLTS